MPGEDLEPLIEAAKRRILGLAGRHCAGVKIFHFGAVDIDPRHLAIWLTTATDAERDRLRKAPGLEAAFREALAAASYPAHAIAEVGFAYESQETVDRDLKGNWWHAVK